MGYSDIPALLLAGMVIYTVFVAGAIMIAQASQSLHSIKPLTVIVAPLVAVGLLLSEIWDVVAGRGRSAEED